MFLLISRDNKSNIFTREFKVICTFSYIFFFRTNVCFLPIALIWISIFSVLNCGFQLQIQTPALLRLFHTEFTQVQFIFIEIYNIHKTLLSEKRIREKYEIKISWVNSSGMEIDYSNRDSIKQVIRKKRGTYNNDGCEDLHRLQFK